MKASIALIITFIILFSAILVLPVCGYNIPAAGVKKGDWVEYDISITGPPLDQARNLTWFRSEIIDISGSFFHANMTSVSVNGTVLSSIWTFNLTEGQVCGWVIIPANLSVGDQFFDLAKSSNVTVEGQMEKEVAGVTRTVTYANDPGKLYKEWDKTTGVYVNSIEYTKNFKVVTNATATNLWSAQTESSTPTQPYVLISLIIVIAILLPIAIFPFLKRPEKKAVSKLSQRKIAALTIFAVVVAEIAFILFFPFNLVDMNFAQINLIFQTFWTALVFVSIWYRQKGNYFAHALFMLVVMSAWLVGFIAVLTMDPLTNNPTIVSSSPIRLIMNALHGVFSVPALIFGLWLVLLWRPNSLSFPSKSLRIAQLLIAFWIPSYIIGVIDYLLLHTTVLG